MDRRTRTKNSLRHFAHPSPILKGEQVKSAKFGLDFRPPNSENEGLQIHP